MSSGRQSSRFCPVRGIVTRWAVTGVACATDCVCRGSCGGWKWSLAVDAGGVPVAWAAASAHTANARRKMSVACASRLRAIRSERSTS